MWARNPSTAHSPSAKPKRVMIPGVGDDAAGAADEASPPDSPTDDGGARTVGLQSTAPINVTGGANAASSTDDSSSAASSVAASVPVPSAASLLALGAAGSEPVSEQTLAEREEALSALLAASELEHAELSERMMRVYEAQAEKLVMLRQMEKTLSSQAGSLLKRLQSEEASTAQLSAIIKRYKSEHKKLLAKIANPRWEIAHHYHMTCVTSDHQALVRGRGWTDIERISVGEEVWALVEKGSDRAQWSAVTATVKHPLRPDEELYEFRADGLNLLTNKDHLHWVREGDAAAAKWVERSSGDDQWGQHEAHFPTAATHDGVYQWPLEPFLPADINSNEEKNAAWCRFLGFFLAAGSLALRDVGASPSDKLVLLQLSSAGESGQDATEELVRVMGVLGWMDAHSPSDSDARPSFALSRPPSSPIGSALGPCVLRAACPALYDYLSPMVAATPASSLAFPSPIPNAPSRSVRDQPLSAPAADEIPPAAAQSQADDWNAVMSVPVASSGSSYAPSSPHRCLHHPWQFLLSTFQARALISGWLLAQGALPAPALKAELQPSPELPPGQALAAPTAAAVGATASVALRDDLVLLGALAGWQASVQAHPAAPGAWSVCFQTFSGRETSAQTAAFHPRKPRVVPSSEHQQTHVFCLTVETRNFLVRRLESHAASHPNFTHNCIEHQLGHRQPHVLDVAELLPGHLRIFSLARGSSLYKRALMYYSSKSKSDRNSVSESIQESYKRLREVRKEMKEIQRLMDLMREKTKEMHIAAAAQRSANVRMQRQDSGERSFAPDAAGAAADGTATPTTPAPQTPDTAAAGAVSSNTSLSATPTAAAAIAAPSPSSSSSPSGGGPPSRGGPGPGAGGGSSQMSALMRQRQRMLGMGGPGGPGMGRSMGPGQSGRSTGPGVSGVATAAPASSFMGHGTPPSGTSSAGLTAPSHDLTLLSPDTVVLPTDQAAFTALTSPATSTSASSGPSVSTSSSASSSSVNTVLPSPSAIASSSPSVPSPSSSSSSSSSGGGYRDNYRNKYFKTLNLAPKLDFLSPHLGGPQSSLDEQRKDMLLADNMDMKNIHQLLQSLEQSGKASKEKAQQLSVLRQYRKRMGVESLPQPHFDDGSIATGDAPASPGPSAADEQDPSPFYLASPLGGSEPASSSAVAEGLQSLVLEPAAASAPAPRGGREQSPASRDQRSSAASRAESPSQSSSRQRDYSPAGGASSTTRTGSSGSSSSAESRAGSSHRSGGRDSSGNTSGASSGSNSANSSPRSRPRPTPRSPSSSPAAAPEPPPQPITLFSSARNRSSGGSSNQSAAGHSSSGGEGQPSHGHSSRSRMSSRAHADPDEHGR